MQQSRRSNPYPFTWEIPLMLAVTVLLLLVLGVQAGRAGANLAAGAGVVLPAERRLVHQRARDPRRRRRRRATAGRTRAGHHRPRYAAWVAAFELMILVAPRAGPGGPCGCGGDPTASTGWPARPRRSSCSGAGGCTASGRIIRPDLYGKERS